MEKLPVVYTQVPGGSDLLRDYLTHFDRVRNFYNGSPFGPVSFKNIAAELSGSEQPHRESLVEILKRQNRALGAGEETLRNIEWLKDHKTVAVVTGQQVGLFSGPAFTLYKALTAIRLTQYLKAQGMSVVPVFWLATEDHDLEEVASANVFGDEYELVHLADPGERPAPQSPVGRVKLTAASAGAIDHLESLIPAGESRDRTLADLRESYQPGETWGNAFGNFLARLFGRYGVIFIDPLDAAVHRLSAPVYRKAIEHAAELRRELISRSDAIVQAGYHAQVRVAEDSTLIFCERAGNRLPLHQTDPAHGKFNDGSQEISANDLLAEIDRQPLCFSANVLLRPVVQDSMLPTVAYVAGPSELAYLAQTGALYPVFGRSMPVIFPRAGFTLVDSHLERWLGKYDLSIENVWQGEEELSRHLASTALAEGWAERFDATERELAGLLDRLREDVESLDPTLVDAVKHAEEKIQYQIERLKGKMTRSALNRSQVLERHRRNLLRAIMPEKQLQERVICGAYFLGRAGYGLLDRLLELIPVDAPAHGALDY